MHTKYEGNIDYVERRHVHGWIWSPLAENKCLDVDIYIDDKYVDTIVADFKRHDLISAEKGNGCHGFIYKIPHRFSDDKEHSVSIRIDKDNFILEKKEVFKLVGEEV